MIDAETRALIAAFPLGFVATVTGEGAPAVSPKGTFLVLDDSSIGFADIRSPGTLKNLGREPRCEVNFIDVLKRKGARLAGTARIVARGEGEFDALLPQWQAIWPDLTHRMRSLVVIAVDKASHYKTPPYDDGATEEEMVALYKAKLGSMYP